MQVKFTAPVDAKALESDLQNAFPGSKPRVLVDPEAETIWGSKCVEIDGITTEEVLTVINAHRKRIEKSRRALQEEKKEQEKKMENKQAKDDKARCVIPTPDVVFPTKSIMSYAANASEKKENLSQKASSDRWQEAAKEEHGIIENIAARIAGEKDVALLAEVDRAAKDQKDASTQIQKALGTINETLSASLNKIKTLENVNATLFAEGKRKNEKIKTLEDASAAKAKALSDLRSEMATLETKIKVISGEKLPDLDKVIATLDRMKKAFGADQ